MSNNIEILHPKNLLYLSIPIGKLYFNPEYLFFYDYPSSNKYITLPANKFVLKSNIYKLNNLYYICLFTDYILNPQLKKLLPTEFYLTNSNYFGKYSIDLSNLHNKWAVSFKTPYPVISPNAVLNIR